MSGMRSRRASAERDDHAANPDPDFKDVLPAPPTAMRDFPRSDTLALFAEVYDNQTRRAAPRRDQDDGDWPTTARSSTPRRTSGGARSWRAKGAATATPPSIPLKELAPGRYVLRVEAQTLLSNGGHRDARVEFRIR